MKPAIDPTDLEAGFEFNDDFGPFPQKNELFRRSWWDERIRNKKTEAFYRGHSQPVTTWRKAIGYRQLDYALRNAAWRISDLLTDIRGQGRREGFTDLFTLQRDVSSQQMRFETPHIAARSIKQAATALGAGLVGITHFDKRWQYSVRWHDAAAQELPPELGADLEHVIVVAVPMPYDVMKTVPSALGSAAAGVGYSRVAALVISLSQFIRDLGYEAEASMNDTAASIPYAIKAGLGELGRNGLLITPRFGPRVRLGRVYTNLPMTHDHPRSFGVQQFCQICKRCAKSCPAKALPMGPPSFTINNISNRPGIKKWMVDAEKCFGFWAAQNTDCATCIRVCPYNKDYGKWWHRLAARLAGSPLRPLILALDNAMGYGQRQRPDHWWDES